MVNILLLKFTSDEAAGWKVDILEPLFYGHYLAMPDLFVETSLVSCPDYFSRVRKMWSGNETKTSLPKVRWKNLHCCCLIKIALTFQVQNQERSMLLISNMHFLASSLTNSCIRYSSLQREWLFTIHAKILLTAFVVLTFFCMSELAPAARRSSTTLWWPLKLAVCSGVIPSYSECLSVL